MVEIRVCRAALAEMQVSLECCFRGIGPAPRAVQYNLWEDGRIEHQQLDDGLLHRGRYTDVRTLRSWSTKEAFGRTIHETYTS